MLMQEKDEINMNKKKFVTQVTNQVPNNKTETTFKPTLEQKKLRLLIVVAAILGASFSLSFWNLNNMPHLSLLLFSIVVLTAGTYAFKQLGYLANPTGAVWAIPILLLSSMNFIFAENAFTYFNVPVVFLLYLVYARSLVSEQTILHDLVQLIRLLFATILPKLDMTQYFIKQFITTQHSKPKTTTSPLKKVLIGITAAIPLFLLLFTLLLSADMVFAEIVGINFDKIAAFFEDFHLMTFAWKFFLFGIATVYFVGFLYHIGLPAKQTAPRKTSWKLDATIGFSFLAVINCLFLFFCVVQFAFLFQNSLFELPAGITYAEYVHSGFFQLLFVSCINFTVVFAFVYLLKSMEQTKATKIMLFFLSFFTAVLIFSSFYRMFMYTEEYGFTFLRMAVLTFLVMETVLVLATVLYLASGKFNLFRICCVIICSAYIVVNLTASEAVVTKLNIDRYHEIGEIDPNYFTDLMTMNSLKQVEAFQKEVSLHVGDPEADILNDTLNTAIADTKAQIAYEEKLSWQNITVMQILRNE